jgi:peroxiredoxin
MPTEANNKTALESPAPNFSLPDVVTGKTVTLSELPPARALLVMFICRHCPYVVHVREEFLRIARDYASKGLSVIAICSNDADQYPEDAPGKLKEMAISHNFPFPLLYDASQQTARAYDAKCTPDFFLYNPQRRLDYRGRLDSSTPGNGHPVTGDEMRAAIDAVLEGARPPADQKSALGCSIKWK